jgi:hypothetical protein
MKEGDRRMEREKEKRKLRNRRSADGGGVGTEGYSWDCRG